MKQTHIEQKALISHYDHPHSHWQKTNTEEMFYYFAYGSCMCPVDLKRSLGENTHQYVIGIGTLNHYRLGFYCYSRLRNCGVLDIIPEPYSSVQGVLYRLPWRLSDRLDLREEVAQNCYRHQLIDVYSNGQIYQNVRTYVVVNKLAQELAPNDWYSNVVLRGAVTCGLPEEYCWQLFHHIRQLQLKQELNHIYAPCFYSYR